MPGSTKTEDQLKMANHCPYKTNQFSEEHHSCPSDIAIRCANAILEEIVELHTVKDQEQQFSGIIARNLNNLFADKLEYDNKIICFWALSEKPSEEELKKGFGHTKKQAQNINLDVTPRDPINAAISKINDEFRSLKFIEDLVKIGIGKSHVFDIQPAADEIIFRAYSKESARESNESQIVFEYRLRLHKNTTIKTVLQEIQKNITGADTYQAETIAYKLIREFCFSFESSANGLLAEIEKKETDKKKKIDRQDAVSACTHFALIALFAEYNEYLHASYILAISFRGKSHSSMILFWPFLFQNSLEPHVMFLLHLILGLNAIDTQAEKRINWMDLAHTHHQKNILRRSVLDPLRRLRNIMKDGEQNIEEYLNVLNRAEASVTNHIKNLSFILNGFKALEKGGCTQIDQEVVDKWQLKNPWQDPLNLKQVCSPERVAFNLKGKKFPIEVLVPLDFLEMLLHLLIQNAIDAMNDQSQEQQKLIRVEIQSQQKSKNLQWCVFSIWSQGALFPDNVLQNAGVHPLDCKSGRSGLGLFIVEHLLESSGAKKEGGRHCHIVNTKTPAGAKVEFSLPVKGATK